LSTLMNGRENQEKENSMKNTDSTSRDHSTSNLLLDLTDTSQLSTTDKWSSRLQMDKKDKSGGSINNHSPSRPRSTTNHGISNLLVRPTRCKSGALTHNGSRSSSTKETNLSMLERTKMSSQSKTARMLKLVQ
jgi:hypothetical protein